MNCMIKPVVNKFSSNYCFSIVARLATVIFTLSARKRSQSAKTISVKCRHWTIAMQHDMYVRPATHYQVHLIRSPEHVCLTPVEHTQNQVDLTGTAEKVRLSGLPDTWWAHTLSGGPDHLYLSSGLIMSGWPKCIYDCTYFIWNINYLSVLAWNYCV
jgi:hypothetical protein